MRGAVTKCYSLSGNFDELLQQCHSPGKVWLYTHRRDDPELHLQKSKVKWGVVWRWPTTDLDEPPQQEVKVCDDLPELVSAEDVVDDLHLLGVGEEVPVKESEMSSNLASRVLGKWDDRLHVLVLQWRLRRQLPKFGVGR